MDPWTALGIFLMGAALGALLTRVAYSGRIHRIRVEIGTLKRHEQERQHEQEGKRGAA
jgi:hypothetical protein